MATGDDKEQEHKNIDDLCEQINAELTQKQKMVIILELTGIILADGIISPREEELALPFYDLGDLLEQSETTYTIEIEMDREQSN